MPIFYCFPVKMEWEDLLETVIAEKPNILRVGVYDENIK